MTGLALMQPDLSAKQVQLLKEALPEISVVGVLWNGTHRGKVLEFRQIEAAARLLGLRIVSAEVRTADDFKRTFEKLRRRAQTLIVLSEPLISSRGIEIAEFVEAQRLPAVADARSWSVRGFLMSYGPDLNEQYRRAARYVDRIMKGARPADIAVERPTRFQLIVNTNTARALGLTIPPSLLLRADEVIQ